MKKESVANSKDNNKDNLLLPFEKINESEKIDRILFRSRNDYLLAGVLGGLANYWNFDSKLIRFIFLLLIPLTAGITVLVYLILIKTIPLEPE